MLPDNSITLINNFLDNIKKNKMYNLNKVINNYMIVNMDETALFLNMSPKRTINEKGDNTIMIKTLGQEKQRITMNNYFIICIC